MADAATEDLAQDVAAAFVGREDAVGDEEGGGAGVVGDDAEGWGAFGFGDGSEFDGLRRNYRGLSAPRSTRLRLAQGRSR